MECDLVGSRPTTQSVTSRTTDLLDEDRCHRGWKRPSHVAAASLCGDEARVECGETRACAVIFGTDGCEMFLLPFVQGSVIVAYLLPGAKFSDQRCRHFVSACCCWKLLRH